MVNQLLLSVLTLVFCLMLVGCDVQTEENLKAKLDSWVGLNVDDFTEAWGAPSGVLNRNDGGKMYTWAFNQTGPTTISPVFKSYIASQAQYSCQINVITDGVGVIKSYSYNGNMCRSTKK